MLNLFERKIATLADRLVLLAPSKASGAGVFRNVEVHSEKHQHFVHELQRLRGGVYLADGAVQQEQLLPDGRHHLPDDENSWHLIMVNKQGRLSACAWYHEYENTITVDQLRLRNRPLALGDGSGAAFSNAVESELARARAEGVRIAEVGGWAVATDSRHTWDGLLLALAGYSLGQIRGECLGLTTATVRHCSSSILRRIGGVPLKLQERTAPHYYDPRYGCVMEVLRFDSRRPNARYAKMIELVREKLETVLLTRVSDPRLADHCDAPQGIGHTSMAMA